MKELEHAKTAESEDSRARSYVAPNIVIIGPLEEITLGALSQKGDPGGTGLREPK